MPRVYMKLKEKAFSPRYQTPGASGMDLCALERGSLDIGLRRVIPTGIFISIPYGYEGQIRPRSGLSSRGIDVVLGTIDCDYRGELGILLVNNSEGIFTWKRGDRLAQLVIMPVAGPEKIAVSMVDSLDETGRGARGFGSTGV